MGFSAKQVKALRRNLDYRSVRTREANGRELSYIEGWYAISEANRKGESSVVNETDSGLLLAERQYRVSSCRRKARAMGCPFRVRRLRASHRPSTKVHHYY